MDEFKNLFVFGDDSKSHRNIYNAYLITFLEDPMIANRILAFAFYGRAVKKGLLLANVVSRF